MSGRAVPPEQPGTALNPLVDEVTAPWWEATRERRLLLQRCGSCGRHQHYPRALCTGCTSTDLAFTEASGGGVVYSFTVVERSPDPVTFPPPYVVALVDLAEGPRLLTALVGWEAGTPACGAPVTLDWRALPDGRHLPVFRPAAAER